jgi:hypothetical protein
MSPTSGMDSPPSSKIEFRKELFAIVKALKTSLLSARTVFKPLTGKAQREKENVRES